MLLLSGRTLVGTVQLGVTQKGGGSTPTTLPLTFLVPAPKQPNGSTGSASSSGAATPSTSSTADEAAGSVAERALREALRDAKIKFLQV